jgi:Icc-related predicted phosphoesterase
MRFLVLSDLHGRHSMVPAARGEAEPYQGVVFAGDLARRWNNAEVASLLASLTPESGRLIAVPGNMDEPALCDVLRERGVSVHGTGVVIDGTGFFGVGGSNPTPFGTPFEIPEDEIARLLERGYAAVRNADRIVLVAHPPPFGCRLDRARLGVHAGSTAVREFFGKHRVDLCLCGHIHEAAGEEDVEGVHCVNVGAAEQGHYALLDIAGGRMTVTRRSVSRRS